PTADAIRVRAYHVRLRGRSRRQTIPGEHRQPDGRGASDRRGELAGGYEEVKENQKAKSKNQKSKVFRVFSEEELRGLTEDVAWLPAAEGASASGTTKRTPFTTVYKQRHRPRAISFRI